MGEDTLVTERCRPVPEGTPPVAGHELHELLEQVEGWEVQDGELTRSFVFEDHYEAVAFVNAVAWISHREDHHPELRLTYDTVTLRYSTHTVGGLSRNDFLCAAKVNRLLE